MFNVVVTKEAMKDLSTMPQIVNIVAGKGISKLIQMSNPIESNDVEELRTAPGFYRWKPSEVDRKLDDNCEFRVVFKIDGNKLVIVGVCEKRTEGMFNHFIKLRKCVAF